MKNIGVNSSAQDNFTGPNAPVSLTATDTPSGRSYNDGRIDLSWSASTGANTPTGYYVRYNGSTIATVAHPTTSYSVTGLSSGTSYSYTVKAYDTYDTSVDSPSASATATTVPATMSAPSATAGVDSDSVSFTAPATGGSAITTYRWTSSDGKTGTTASSPFSVVQEANTAQTYQIRAENANGSGVYSGNSNSVTTQAPSFFGPPSFFSPPGFFAPPGFFSPPGFFGPPSFAKSVGVNTLVRTPSGLVSAGQLEIGDEIIGLSIPGMPDNYWDLAGTGTYASYSDYVFTEEQIANAMETVTTVVGKVLHENIGAVAVNGDIYTLNHFILAKRDNEIKSLNVRFLLNTDLIYNHQTQDFVPVEAYEKNEEITIQSYSINVEPFDFYFTENGLTFDMQALEVSLSGENELATHCAGPIHDGTCCEQITQP